MGTTDIIIITLLGIGFVRGLLSGFIRQVLSVAGFLAGLLVAYLLHQAVGDWITTTCGSSPTVGKAVAFIAIWIAVPVAASALASLLTSVANGLKLGALNRLAGALLGTAKYALFAGCLLTTALHLKMVRAEALQQSHLSAPVTQVSTYIYNKVCQQISAQQ